MSRAAMAAFTAAGSWQYSSVLARRARHGKCVLSSARSRRRSSWASSAGSDCCRYASPDSAASPVSCAAPAAAAMPFAAGGGAAGAVPPAGSAAAAMPAAEVLGANCCAASESPDTAARLDWRSNHPAQPLQMLADIAAIFGVLVSMHSSCALGFRRYSGHRRTHVAQPLPHVVGPRHRVQQLQVQLPLRAHALQQ